MISVVVATYNRAAVMEEMLESFYAQEHLEENAFELLLIDNCSTDTTAEKARRFEGRPGFRYIHEARQGLSHARNRGVEEAKGDIIAFLDDDVLVDPHWLQAITKSFSETGAAVVGGRSYLIFEAPVPPWFGPDFRRYLSEVDLGKNRCAAGEGQHLFGLNLAMKKEAILQAGGFDVRLGRTGAVLLGGEEWAIMRHIHRFGGRLLYAPDAVVGHRIDARRLEWDYFCRIAVGTAHTRLRLDADDPPFRRGIGLLQSLIKLMAYTALWIPCRLFMPNRYPARALACRRLRLRTLCAGRIRAMVK